MKPRGWPAAWAFSVTSTKDSTSRKDWYTSASIRRSSSRFVHTFPQKRAPAV